jgi:phage gp29-like protein
MRFKIGNLELLAERNTKRPEIGELGGTGTQVFAGMISEEYNPDLRGQKAITTYDKMRKSDARVKSSILVCELPLRSIEWHIEPASESPKDEEIAQALEDNLFNMTITWDSCLHHIMLMLPFGFSIFEKVWEIVDGKVRYRKLAPRLPKTLSKWLLDANGGLSGIEQHAFINDVYKTITIPSDKLLVFTNEKEGSNFEGTSILRTAYKHWYYKDNLYRIDGIGAEKNAVAFLKLTYPTTASDADIKKCDEVGQHYQAHENQYVSMPDDHDAVLLGATGHIKDLMPSIEHHNKAIAESVLADFLNLGTGNVGSWALSKDKSSFFLMSLGALGKNICDTFNAYAIPQWVQYNYGDVDLPKLVHGKLDTRNLQEYATAATSLLQSGGITHDNDVENTLREMLDLPQKEDKKTFSVKLKERELTQAEKYVSFTEIKDKLDSAERMIIEACKEVMERQINNIVDESIKIIEKGQLDKISDLEVRYKTQMTDKIYTVLEDLLKFGGEQVKKELSVQNVKLSEPVGAEDDKVVDAYLKARASAGAATLGNKLKQSATFEILRQIKEGVIDKEELKRGLLDLSDKELIAIAQYSASEAFNYGRNLAIKLYLDEIDRVQYSALLDENTCSECEKLDGREWNIDAPEVARYAGGNPNCLGGGRCRCMLVYISKYETRAVK